MNSTLIYRSHLSNFSNASRVSAEVGAEDAEGDHQGQGQPKENDVPAFKVAMLGAAGVGKTTLTYQFTTSEYICAYDLSLGKYEDGTFWIRPGVYGKWPGHQEGRVVAVAV